MYDMETSFFLLSSKMLIYFLKYGGPWKNCIAYTSEWNEETLSTVSTAATYTEL